MKARTEKYFNGFTLFLWLAFAALALFACAGCARCSKVQAGESYQYGKIARQITTHATATTCVASKTALAQWKASQTDKTQGASVGALSQESAGAETIKAVTELLKAAKPVP